MDKVRFGIIGTGVIGQLHADSIASDTGRYVALTAVCDCDADRARAVGEAHGVAHFADAGKLFDSGLCDAVIIATPHYAHGPLTIRAARAGLHVLCEKPLASSVTHARAMIAECKKRRRQLGAMLQHRTRGIMQTARKLVADGALGEVFRVQMICSGWFRTQAYYDSGAWRGTWDGEGGGVLINQAPHHLDLFQWIGLGLPQRLIAVTQTREHEIEVEDTANILCDYGNGRMGYICATTAELPGMEQFILSGDKATMVIQDDTIRLGTLKVPIKDFTYSSKAANAGVSPTMTQDCTWREVPYRRPKTDGAHIEIIRGFARKVLGRGEQYAPGAEAINELELSNAAYLSGYADGRAVDVPVDGAKVDRLLAKLDRQRSTGKGGGLRAKHQRQFTRLMRR
ncbi:MAG: Gfo/Idh/MocA family oxidoreductase [Phycisphaerae bacterium]|nr:Gfo/Idh/MocA family oxidoreductase [Phycisphaerae bacterium]